MIIKQRLNFEQYYMFNMLLLSWLSWLSCCKKCFHTSVSATTWGVSNFQESRVQWMMDKKFKKKPHTITARVVFPLASLLPFCMLSATMQMPRSTHAKIHSLTFPLPPSLSLTLPLSPSQSVSLSFTASRAHSAFRLYGCSPF